MLLTRVSLQHSLRAASETERHTVTNITHSPSLEQSHATWSRKQAQYLGCGDGKKYFSYSILASTYSYHDILLRLEKEDALHGSV